MSDLRSLNGPGAGEKFSDLGHYSQAVWIGNVLKCSGQGGWDDQGSLEGLDWKEQVDKAFENVDGLLQAAGLRGWEDVSLSGTISTHRCAAEISTRTHPFLTDECPARPRN